MNLDEGPKISPAFTIDDIHKIREWNYERQKNMTASERIADTNARAASVIAEIEALRIKKPPRGEFLGGSL
jgi:hypothetical protein